MTEREWIDAAAPALRETNLQQTSKKKEAVPTEVLDTR
jgi:hypothetical protein